MVGVTLTLETSGEKCNIRRPRLKEGERARDYRCGSLALLRLSTNLQATDASTAPCCSNTRITGTATYCAPSSQHEPGVRGQDAREK